MPYTADEPILRLCSTLAAIHSALPQGPSPSTTFQRQEEPPEEWNGGRGPGVSRERPGIGRHSLYRLLEVWDDRYAFIVKWPARGKDC